MQIAFADAIPEDADTVLAAVGEGRELLPSARAFDETAGGTVGRAVGTGRFRGKKGETLDILAPDGVAAERIVAVGVGDDYAALGPLDRQRLGGKVWAHLDRIGARHVAAPASSALDVCDFAHGMALRSYRFDAYRTKIEDEDRPTLEKITVVADDLDGAEDKARRLRHLADGVFLTRDLVSEPANALYPEEFARRASGLSALGVDVETLGEAKMAELGMGALLGVGRGSEKESQLVVMRWEGGGDDPWLAVVGKGVCFDSGGISLKPGAGMEEMKFDMAGAGCVTGLMHALAARGARANVVGVIGCVENMPSHRAQRPGDVVATMSGQTIEVVNTDAEGRLVLADALHYAVETFAPKQIVDLATLTGAIVVALGPHKAGLFSNDDDLAAALLAAGEETGEELWRMPLGERYDKDIASDIADMKNVGKAREAGATAGAVLLRRFVADTPWAHLDIAGTAWTKSDEDLAPKGATGFGVRLLDRFVADVWES